MAETERKVCNTCGGSGEIGYFAGESRFFITREECPACFGLGYVLEEDEPNPESGSGVDTQEGEGA